MDQYAKLPVFTGPNMLPQANMTHIRNNIRPNMAYCNFIFTPRLKAWCRHIREFDAAQAAAKLSNLASQSDASLSKEASNVSSVISAYTPTSKENPCYDSFFCGTPATANILHVAMIFCLVASIIAVVGQVICLPAFNINRNRSGTSLYLTVIAFFDILFLILGSIIFIAKGIPETYPGQLKIYQTLSAKVVPLGLPMMEFGFICVTWFMVAMLIDRYWFHMDTKYSSVTSRCRYFRNIAVIIFVLILYTAPKFLNLTVSVDEEKVGDEKKQMVRVVHFLGGLPLYQDMVLNWGKMIVEILLPGVLIAVFITLVTNRCNVFPPRNSETTETTGDTLTRYRSKEAANTSLTIWICSLLGLVLAVKVICHFILLSKLESVNIRDVIINGEYALSVLFVCVRPVVYVASHHSIRRYILFGWICRNTPPPQPITDVQYVKCDHDSNSTDSDPLKETA